MHAPDAFRKLGLSSLVAAFSFAAGMATAVLPQAAYASAAAENEQASPPRSALAGQLSSSRNPALHATDRTVPADAQGRYSVIVRFAEPSLASYEGGVPGLSATNPRARGERRLDVGAPQSQAYLSYLEGRQATHLTQIGSEIGRSVQPQHQYLNVLNAVALRLTLAEAEKLRTLDFVSGVSLDELHEPTTDAGPGFIGAPAFWSGASNSGNLNRGEGVVIGIIDSGFVHAHPSFAQVAPGDGYVHVNPNGDGVFFGLCVATPSLCNNKLIGSYNFHPDTTVSEDTSGHGTHVASTAGGNPVTASFAGLSPAISGVAPRANLINYRVCFPTCPTTSSLSAVSQAIADGVDVINYSISGSDNPWIDSVDLAFLDAFNAGIYVSASAGNSGPGATTVAHTGPWNATVANSTHNRIFTNLVDAAGLIGLGGVPGSGPEILVDTTADVFDALTVDPANEFGCNPFLAGSFTGAHALIQRGGCTFVTKVDNAVAAGAVGVLVFNNAGGPPIVMGGLEATTVPAVMLTLSDGLAVRAAITPGAQATIYAGTSVTLNASFGDILNSTSSRGPSQFDLISPDYSAPGTNILAAYYDPGASPVFGAISGTSMSSPHSAGAAALMSAEHPTWSPAAIKSALSLTAQTAMLKENALTPSDPFDRGSGRIDLNQAAIVSLVMDETGANFVAANPGAAGDPRTLNLPSIMDRDCVGGCSFTRTVSSVISLSQDYTVETSAPAGVTVTVTPNAFSLGAGADQVLTIDVAVDINTADLGNWNFGEIRLVPAPASSTVLLDEQFTDVTFPPVSWASFKLAGAGAATWIRDTAQSVSAPASARRVFGGSADGNQDDWLVTPALAILPGTSLTYFDRGEWMGDYGYSGVWISTASCDPGIGNFVELVETADIPNNAWRAAPVEVDLSAFAGQNACIAFRYSGTFAHTWWIDDVEVVATSVAFPTLRMPLAVVPKSAIPDISVDVASISSSQPTGQTETRNLQISNSGGVDLVWSIAEAPAAARMGLTLGDEKAVSAVPAPHSLILDDGVGENSIGVGGAQFIWLNRFTPSPSSSVTLETVDVMFGYPGSTGGINVGELVDIYLYEDPDGDPANGATHRASLTGQAVQAVDGTTWSSFTLSAPVTFEGAGDILIAVVNRTAGVAAGTYPAVIDQNSGSQGRSWAGFGAVPGDPPVLPMPTMDVIDNFGLAGNWLVRGFGTAIIPCDDPSDVSWLTVNPSAGTTAGGAQAQVTVTLDSTGLATGTYSAALCLESNDPDTPLVDIPVSLEVEPSASIQLSETALAGSAPIDGSTQATFDIGNIGDAQLDWTVDTAAPFLRAPQAAAQVIYDNGPFVTSVGTGPSGSDVSLLQNTSLGLTTLGMAAYLSGAGPNFRIADNFTVNSALPWDVRTVRLFAYQTGSTTTSTFTGANLQIWDGEPGAPGSSVVFGDSTTNRLVGTGWTGAYRYAESGLGTTRPIMFVDAEINTVLPPGDYWLDWQLAGSIASGPWQPPITIIGQAVTGDARQLVTTGWQPLVDGGAGNPAQGAPFVISGFLDWCEMPSAVTWLSITPTAGSTAPAGSDTVTVTMDATGLTVGNYEAKVCVFSNDPLSPLVSLPVSFEVTQIPQAIDFTALADRTIGESPFTVAATASSGLPVSFASLTGTVCSMTGDEVSLLAEGTCSIEATQAGDATYLPADAVVQSFQVTLVAQTIDFAALADRLIGDSPFTVAATASSGLPVSFASLTGSVCSVSGNEVSLLAIGTCSIEATQAGNATYAAAASVLRSFDVLDADVVVAPGSLQRGTIDVPYSVTFTASGTGSTAPFTYAVTGGALPAGLALAASGELTGTPTESGAFAFTVTATDSSAPGIGGPFSGSRAYTLEIDEEFIFFDGFESLVPVLKLSFEKEGSHVATLPLVGVLGAGPEAGQVFLVGEVMLKGQRVALLQARCQGLDCELRVLQFTQEKSWQAGGWWAIQSEPFALSLELGQGLLIKAQPAE